MDTLNPTQLSAIGALLRCRTIKEAAAEVGCSERTIRRYLQNPEFLHELRQQQNAVLASVRAGVIGGSEDAIAALRDLLDTENEGVKSRVAMWWVDRMEKTFEVSELLARLEALEAMTNDDKKPSA